MPIPAEQAVAVEDYTPAPTRSPFYLRVNGIWLPLEGLNPGASRQADRAVSELVSVDGVRYVQQSYRAARSWEVDWSFANPAAVVALAFAAQTPGDVWLWDGTEARANAFPDRACYGPEAHPVLMCGAMPLRSLTAGVSGTGAGAVVVTRPILPEVPIVVGVWTDAAAAVTVGTVDDGGGVLSIVAPPGTGSRLASVELNAPATESLTVTITASVTHLVSGLILTDGLTPQSWVSSKGTPCQVAVSDPGETLLRHTDGLLPMTDYAVTLREVG